MRRLSCLLISLALIGLMHQPVFGQANEGEPKAKKEDPKAKKDEPKAKKEDPKAKKDEPKTKKEALANPRKTPIQAGPSFKHLNGQTLVYVANGLGGSTTVSDNLNDLNGEYHLGLRIQPISWCRHNAVFQDLKDQEAQWSAAAKIANSVTAIRKDAPKARIFLVGYSAGARVVLAAAEMLPARSIDRIIVIAPAVSCYYDLTGALKASREGIDNFWSANDGLLDSDNAHYRNADGQRGPAAGRVGFRPLSHEKKDLYAYRHLRQHPWNENLCGSGGHFGWTLRPNMKKVIVPLFAPVPIACEPAVEKKAEKTKSKKK
jgi:pimeloyl-ACP methyl ester carboxylesterase